MICTDLDGTLLRSDKTVSRYSLEVLKKASDKGILIVPVTGRPLSMMLMRKNATVTLCHSHTSPEDLIRYCHNADLIFVMVGKPKTIKTEHVRPGQVIVDIGINVDKNGKLCGDTDFDNLLPIVKAITPVPGGVGAMTSVMLLEHLITAAVRSRKGLS